MSLFSEAHEYDVYVFGTQKPLRLTFRLFLNRLFIFYIFGSYKHQISLDADGSIEEVVLRGDRVLSTEKILPKIYTNAPPSSKKNKINHAVLNLVSGAANGIFGIGITKAERFENLFLCLDIFKSSKFTVELNQSAVWSPAPLLSVDFDCKTFKIIEKLSDCVRHV